MEEEIESLSNIISMLIDKLHGIGIEIYHLNNSISHLANKVEDLVNNRQD